MGTTQSSAHIHSSNAEKIYAFELWCWRRLLRAPWTARRSNQSILKETSPGCSLKDLCWNWNSNTLATSCKELTYWKRPWCWEGLGAGEGDDRGWDGWMALPTRWAWVWVNSGNWWWTGRPDILRFTGSQRVRHNWAIELNWTELNAGPMWTQSINIFPGLFTKKLRESNKKTLTMHQTLF